MSTTESLTHGRILSRAWPLIVANSTVPLLGLVDTAVLGNFGSVVDLGAVALGALIFSFVYWGFGFLRMGTTGFVAQASGAGDEPEVRAALGRSMLIASLLGLGLILLQIPLNRVAFSLLSGSAEAEATASAYFLLRIWGAPATLGMFALVGTLVGLGQSKKLLLIQLVLNLINIALDIWFAGVMGMGAVGVALGTLIAEWIAYVFALVVLVRTLKARYQGNESFFVVDRILDRGRLFSTLFANMDILLRTFMLVFAFAWFTNQSARFGDVVLAANHILLQLISFSAFFLDGFAFVVESYVGTAVGARNKKLFSLAVRKTTELALVTAIFLVVAIVVFGQGILMLLTDIDAVFTTASGLLYLAAIYVLLSFPAFQLDGIFIGATFTAQMRNASFVSLAIFLLGWMVLSQLAGVTGLWWAFILYVCARAVCLYYYYPALKRSI